MAAGMTEFWMLTLYSVNRIIIPSLSVHKDNITFDITQVSCNAIAIYFKETVAHTYTEWMS